MPWIETLFETLLKEYPIPESLNILPASQRPSPRARISMVKEGAVKDLLPLEPATRYYASTLVGNRRITAADWSQDVRHLVFRFDDDIE
jgi:sulfite reductase alpha subunit-like flavoprotein